MTQGEGEPQKHTNISIIIQAVIGAMILLDITINKGANVKSILDSIGVLGLLK